MRREREPIDTLIDAHAWLSKARRAPMSNKPDRPLMAATLSESPLAVESFPAQKDALEFVWAQRFTDALEKQRGTRYVVAGRAPDPGDVLLGRDGEQDIYLQIASLHMGMG
jgi:hypothetical protein